jgi:hypothetical protein
VSQETKGEPNPSITRVLISAAGLVWSGLTESRIQVLRRLVQRRIVIVLGSGGESKSVCVFFSSLSLTITTAASVVARRICVLYEKLGKRAAAGSSLALLPTRVRHENHRRGPVWRVGSDGARGHLPAGVSLAR